MRGPSALGLTLTLALALPATAEIYSWTDAEGHLHYAQDLARVPPEHRAEARERAERDPGPSRVQTYSSPQTIPRSAARRGAARPGSNGTIRIPFQKHGTLMRVEAELNGWLAVPFFVDTGASGIALPKHVADQLGLRVGPDTPRLRTQTANGVVARPVVRLESVRVGKARVDGLEATINPSLDIGLLGGSFFNNFVYRVDAASNAILLTRNERVRRGLTEAQWREQFRSLHESIARIDAYVPTLGQSQRRRRAELAERRSELVEQLEGLEREADRAEVPHAWRD